MPLYTDSESAQIAITTVHAVLAILNITGNSLVFVVIMKNQDMRTSINYLLMNLAVADMTVATFFAPQYIFKHTFIHPNGLTGTVLCKLLTAGNLGWVGGGASVFTLVAIAMERYYAVMRPYGRKFTDGKVKVIIPCSWIFGVIMMIPVFLVQYFDDELHYCGEMWPEEWMGKANSLIWLLVLAFLPVTLMFTLYSRVAYTLWCKRAVSSEQSNRQKGVIKVRKRVTLMAITVSVIFGVCWLTDSISYVLTFYIPTHALGDLPYVITSTMIMFNSAVNPIVYALVNQRFREKIKGMMCCTWPSVTKKTLPAKEPQSMEVIYSTSHSTQKRDKVPKNDACQITV